MTSLFGICITAVRKGKVTALPLLLVGGKTEHDGVQSVMRVIRRACYPRFRVEWINGSGM